MKRSQTGRPHRTRLSTPRPPQLGVKAKFWLTLGPGTLFGDGKAELLEAVDRLGSLRSAAQSMEMSYRYAWGLLRELDAAAGFPFLEHSGSGPRTSLRLTANGDSSRPTAVSGRRSATWSKRDSDASSPTEGWQVRVLSGFADLLDMPASRP